MRIAGLLAGLPRWSERLYTPTVAIQLILAGVYLCFAMTLPSLGDRFSAPFNAPQVGFMFAPAMQRCCISIIIACGALIVFFSNQKADEDRHGGKEFCVAAALSFFFYWLVFTRTCQVPVAFDDAYLDFRYVYNWINGLGFDYNMGERVMGFTSHFHLMLLSACAFLFNRQDVALLSQLLNMVLQCTTYLLTFVTFKQVWKSASAAALGAIVFAVSDYNLQQAIVGKEAALVAFLLVLSLWTLINKRWKAMAWATTLLFLTRPEGFVVPLLGLGWSLKTHGAAERKQCLKTWMPPLLVAGAWYLFLFIYFGTIVPHGALGRAAMFHRFLTPIDHTLCFVIITMGTDTFGHLVASLLSPDLSNDLIWILQGIVALLLLFDLSRREKPLKFYFWIVMLELCIFAITDPWIFAWYYSWFTLVPVILIPFMVRGLWHICRSRNLITLRLLALFLIAALLDPFLVLRSKGMPIHGLLNTIADAHTLHVQSTLFSWDISQSRLVLYKQAAEYLRAQGALDSVASIEPGMLGYYLPGVRVIDLGGLVSEEALKYFPMTPNSQSTKPVWLSIPPAAVAEMKPQWLVLFDCFADNGLFKDQFFLSNYKLMKFWPLPIWGGRGLCVYRMIGK